MHTFLVIDFWLLIAALVVALVLSLRRTHAWRKS
jgi:hypothetical protein